MISAKPSWVRFFFIRKYRTFFPKQTHSSLFDFTPPFSKSYTHKNRDYKSYTKGAIMLNLYVVALIVTSFFSPILAGRNSSGRYKSTGYGYTNTKSAPVRGSINKKTGTYTKPHRRTAPNKTQRDNFSTKGNQNPWTGTKGTKGADK